MMTADERTDAISRSATLKEIYEMDISDCTDAEDIISKAYATIANAPALDVASVVHARWKMTDSPYCSICNRIAVMRYKYCPNCGARMDGDAE